MLMKRATKVLQHNGLNLEIHKGMYGYSVRNPAFPRQTGKVFKSIDDAVTAVAAGYRPTEVNNER